MDNSKLTEEQILKNFAKWFDDNYEVYLKCHDGYRYVNCDIKLSSVLTKYLKSTERANEG